MGRNIPARKLRQFGKGSEDKITPRGSRPAAAVSFSVGLLVFAPTPALAYVGPGAGLSVIGAIFGLVVVFLFAVAGLIWYPFKKLMRKNRTRVINSSDMTDKQSSVSEKT